MPGRLRAAGLHCITWMRENGSRPWAGTASTHVGGTMVDIDKVGVFLGLDVGKHTHHGHGLTLAGKKV